MRFGSAIAGAVILIVIVVVVLIVVSVLGLYDVSADRPHSPIGRVIAYVRERSIDVRAEGIAVPPLGKPEMIADGAGHYDAMCTGCHLAPGMPDNPLRAGMNPRPPKLAAFGPLDPKEEFWSVKHGIRMTGMPAWGVTHSDADIWNIVAFLQKLPKLSPERYRALVKQGGQHEGSGQGGMPMPH